MNEPIGTAPALELTPPAIAKLIESLREDHAMYRPVFPRREPRTGTRKSLHGLVRERPRTAIAPLVLAVDGATAKAVRTVDGRDVRNQGPESVGANRQDGGAGGQRAHGQAGVVLGEASHQGAPRLARRLDWPHRGWRMRRRPPGGRAAGCPPTSPSPPWPSKSFVFCTSRWA